MAQLNPRTNVWKAAEPAARSGRIAVDDAGHEVAYSEWGEGDRVILGLHGGPGLDHRYIQRLADLADADLRVVLYDQLGGGESDRPDDPGLWQIDRFVDELTRVREHLGLERVHLFGQSWGGWLALQSVLDGATGIESLILSNTSASIPETFKGMTRLRTEVGAADYGTLMASEGRGDLEDPTYVDIVDMLYATHLRRSIPFEPELSLREYRALAKPILETGDAFYEMWGPHEFLCTGNLAQWDVTDRLAEIRLPTLILSALYDHLVIPLQEAMAEGIEGSELLIFGRSSHLTILEGEADAYLAAIRHFIDVQAD